MQISQLQAMIRDESSFIAAFKKAMANPETSELFELIRNKFEDGRTSYVKKFVFPDKSELRFKFTDAVKTLINSKLQPIPGKESFVIFFELSVFPVGMKAYAETFQSSTIPWGNVKAKAQTARDESIAELKVFAADLGINLESPDSWCKVSS